MALHDQLRTLVNTHGASILDHAEGFRAALDDFLTEDEATAGEMNLLVDAVRLGSVQRLVALLDQGATPEAALDEAAAQLARDRDTAPDRARWALAMLGYALARTDTTIPRVAVEEEPASPETVVAPDPAATAGVSTPGRSRRALVVGLVLAAVLALGGVAAALLLSDDDGDGGGGGADDPAAGPIDEPSGACPAPTTPPVDTQADESATCLAGQFDEWAEAGVMAVGQQVNLDNDAWTDPLTALAPDDVRIVGFDFEELANAAVAGKDRVPDLIALAEQGHVLTASWHADNPWTGEYSDDLTDQDRVAELLDPPDPADPAYTKFWGDWDEAIAAIGRLQEAGVPLIVRPLHEANGGWFWWGQLDPALYQELWTAMRERVEEAGLHNVLWHFAAAPKTWEGIQDPLELLPEVDFAGLDTYDCEQPGTDAEVEECGGPDDYEDDYVELASYAELEGAAPRMSLSEVGPQFSFDGSWDPSVVTTSLIDQGFQPVYAMFWFDDQRQGRPPMSKQLASLQGGPDLLASCSEALCYVGES